MAEHEACRRAAYLRGLASFEHDGLGLLGGISAGGAGREGSGRHHDGEAKWSNPACVNVTGAPCASISRRPASASMRPMRV